MSLKKIRFSDLDHGLGQLGGGAWLDDLSLWPSNPDTGALLLPVITLTPRFLGTPFIAEGMAVTVFISAGSSPAGFDRASLRKFTVNQQSELSALPNGYSRVIVHKLADRELSAEQCAQFITRKFIQLEDFTETDLEEELEDEDSGAPMSKVLGRPCWLQDPIYESPRYYFLAQLQDADIRAVSPMHEGLFGAGTGYIFLDNRAKKAGSTDEAGYFFIQFT